MISRAAALDVLVTSPNFNTTLTWIEELPAVEAIPVNWISAYMNKAYGWVRAEIIREMLDAWMEQEAR